LQRFAEWVPRQTPTKLHNWLIDAYWKGNLKGTDLHRAFLFDQAMVRVKVIGKRWDLTKRARKKR
jgi:hypothetical protein